MKTEQRFRRFLIPSFAGLVLVFLPRFVAAESTGKAMIHVVDKATSQPLPCRIHVFDSAGKPQRAGSLPFWHDHFVCPGTVELDLSPGSYRFEIDRGPEYLLRTGSFAIREGEKSELTAELERLADMAAEGWWSGELHVHRSVKNMELLMRAEDLHVAPVITWWNTRNQWGDRLPGALLVEFDGNRFYHVMGGEDEREGGALLYFGLSRPLDITAAGREYPSPMKFLAEAREHPGAWIDIEKPFWWDVPSWLASGQVDSIGLANNHMCRSQMYEDEAWGKPRDAQRLPPPLGNGFWTQEIYYQILNCGLRVPPSAGSASGVLPNPVGYNRVYVQLGETLTYASWWEGLRAGRSFVTNGPLVRCRAAGEFPGHVFSGADGQEMNIDIDIALSSRDPIRAVEIIRDGRVERSMSFDEWKKSGSLGSLRFTRSGWFLVRVIADNPKTFRFASTAPFYVEIGPAKRRVSRTAAQFFVDWVEERSQRVQLEDPVERDEVLRYHDQAKDFWRGLVEQANAE